MAVWETPLAPYGGSEDGLNERNWYLVPKDKTIQDRCEGGLIFKCFSSETDADADLVMFVLAR